MVEVGWSMHLKSSENKTGMYFSLTHSCLKLGIKHPSLSAFSVCQSGADQENHGLLQNPEVKFSWAHRDTDVSLSSHTKHQSQTVKPRPESDPAPAEPFTWGHCSWVQEEQDTRDVTVGAERKAQCWFCCVPKNLMQFSHTWKNVDASVYLIGGTSNLPQEHPIFFCFC